LVGRLVRRYHLSDAKPVTRKTELLEAKTNPGLIHPCLMAVLPVVLFLALSLIALHRLLVQPGVIGFHHDWDLSPFPYPYPPSVFLSSKRYLYNTLAYLAAVLGLSGDAFSKLFVLGVVWLSGYSFFVLCRGQNATRIAALVGGLFYMMNAAFFWRIAAGQVAFLLSWSVAPLAVHFFLASIREADRIDLRRAVAAGLFWAMASVEIQFTPLILVLLIVAIVTMKRSSARLGVTALTIAGLVVLLCSSGWALSELLSFSDSGKTLSTLGIISLWTPQSVTYFSPSLLDVVMLLSGGGLSPYYPWALQTIGFNRFLWMAVMGALAAILIGAGFSRDRPRIRLLAVVLIVLGIFLSKGTSPPAGEIFAELLAWLPLFVVFREAFKFSFLTAFGYALMLALTLDIVRGPLQSIRVGRVSVPAPRRRTILAVLVFTLVVIQAAPFYTGDFAGAVQVFNPPQDYREVYSLLANDKQPYNVLWIPAIQPIKYSRLDLAGYDPLITWSPKPAAIPQSGSSPEQLFLALTIQQNRTRYLAGTFLDYFNVKYVIVRSDFESLFPYYVQLRSDVNMWSYAQASYVLSRQDGLDTALARSNFRLLGDEQNRPTVFGTPSIATLAGSMSSIVTISYLNESIPQPNSFVLATEISSGIENLRSSDAYVIDGDNFFDLVGAVLPVNYRIEPGAFASKYYDARSGWTSAGDWWWYDWNYASQLDNGVVTLPPARDALSIPVTVNETAAYSVWIKAYIRNATVSLKVDDNSFGVLAPFKHAGIGWYNLGTVNLTQGQHALTLMSSGGEAYVGRIILAPVKAVAEAYQTVDGLLEGKALTLTIEPEDPVRIGYDINASQGAYYIAGPQNLGTFRRVIYVPEPGSYSLAIRASDLFAPTVNRPRSDVVEVTATQKVKDGLTWHVFENVMLQRGNNTLELSLPYGTRVDLIALHKPGETSETHGAVTTSYQYEGGAYIVQTQSESPFWLVFKPAADEYTSSPWIASVEGKRLDPMQVNLVDLAYRIPAGSHKVRIEHAYAETAVVWFGPFFICFFVVYLVVSGLPSTWREKCRFSKTREKR